VAPAAVLDFAGFVADEAFAHAIDPCPHAHATQHIHQRSSFLISHPKSAYTSNPRLRITVPKKTLFSKQYPPLPMSCLMNF